MTSNHTSPIPVLILASNSPRRQELLAELGLAFQVRVKSVDEVEQPGETPVEMVRRLAQTKAEVIPLSKGEVIIAADTTVVLAGQVLGKPCDAEDARRMLLALRNRVHQVYTGVALRRDGQVRVQVAATDVTMRAYSDDEITEYIAGGSPLDKAGAYGIQDQSFNPVSAITGCYTTVMGLPLCLLAQMLVEWGIAVPRWPSDYCDTLERKCLCAVQRNSPTNARNQHT